MAKAQGRAAKLAGNRVVIDSRSYASKELNMLPTDITDGLKQEKEIDDRNIYRGELSTFSNFCPAPFTLDGIDYAHVEQHYQHTKVLHHNEIETARSMMTLTNPLHREQQCMVRKKDASSLRWGEGKIRTKPLTTGRTGIHSRETPI